MRLIVAGAILFLSLVSSIYGSDQDSKGRLADLEFAKREYVQKAPAFTGEARTKAETLIEQLKEQVNSMSDAQFVFALARIAGLADNAHDMFDLGDGAWSPNLRLPVRMIWFPDQLIIARASPEQADILGARVVSVEGLTPSQLMDQLRPIQGGIDTYRRWQLNWIFHTPESLYALGMAKAPDRLHLRLKLQSGKTINRIIIALPKNDVPPSRHPSRYWIPAPWPGEAEKGWRVAIDPSKAPLYLQDSDAWFRMKPLPEMDALYIQFRSNMDEEGAKIAPFVASVNQAVSTHPPRNVIVDLRFDTGGDNTQNRDLMNVIARKIPGRIYLLVGNYTFSAGIASAAALAHDGGRKVTIVGSEIADRMHWWSEHQAPICLPASKVCFQINSGYWDLVHGCKNNPKCFGDQFNLNVPSLEPQLQAPLLSTDWLANRDPGMQLIAAELQKQK
ncbi:MAG TPA: hypothetical protein VLH08_05545 [Acidobacteriota bacterium]|nr:hypothetical protein [Acidobacteriota bacterium]